MWAQGGEGCPETSETDPGIVVFSTIRSVCYLRNGDVLAEESEVRASHTECVLCDFLLYMFKNYF